jgi:hypothetical protein
VSSVPSKGFMKASLAIVAAAPLVAKRGEVSNEVGQALARNIFTSSERMVNTRLVSTHRMFNCFVSRKVDGVCRSWELSAIMQDGPS